MVVGLTFKRYRLLLAIIVALLSPIATFGDESKSADRLLIISNTASISPETELFTATGNVEVYFNGSKLIAPKVSYNLVSE